MQRRPIIIQDYGPDPRWVGVMVGLGVLALLFLLLWLGARRARRRAQKAHDATLAQQAADAEQLRQQLWQTEAQLRTAQEGLYRHQVQLDHTSRQLGSLQQEHRATQHALTDTRQEVQTQRQLLLQADKLTSVGMLVATVLHELNSPLGAIKGTVQAMAAQVPGLLQSLPSLLATLPPGVLAGFEAVLTAGQRGGADMDARQGREQREQLAEALRAQQVPNPEEAAIQMQRLNLTQVPPAVVPLLHHPESDTLLKAAVVLSKLSRNLETIDASVGRTQSMLTKLRAYAAPADTPPQPTYLADNLDHVLSLYRHHLQPSVQVERQYQNVRPLVAQPDRLMQVWTNLLLNAAQAIRGPQQSGSGCIWISLSREGNEALVRFRDDGPGIPPELIHRIFQPFVSTKNGHGGMGLGLHIAQQIIQDHHGRIEVRSQPGNTVFDIRLPLSPIA